MSFLQERGFAPTQRTHPRAVAALVLGVLGLFCVGLLSPVAWFLGVTALRDIDADSFKWTGRSQARAGKVLGMIGTALSVVALILYPLVR